MSTPIKLVVLFFSAIPYSMASSQWTCSPARWTQSLTWSGNLLQGTREAECNLNFSSDTLRAGDLLNQALINELTSSPSRILAGPISIKSPGSALKTKITQFKVERPVSKYDLSQGLMQMTDILTLNPGQSLGLVSIMDSANSTALEKGIRNVELRILIQFNSYGPATFKISQTFALENTSSTLPNWLFKTGATKKLEGSFGKLQSRIGEAVSNQGI